MIDGTVLKCDSVGCGLLWKKQDLPGLVLSP